MHHVYHQSSKGHPNNPNEGNTTVKNIIKQY